MRFSSARLGSAILLLAASAAAAGAQGLGIPGANDQLMPEFEQARVPLKYVQAYQSVCEDLRGGKDAGNAVLSGLKGKDDEPFRAAIGEFCAGGAFEIAAPAGQKECTAPRKLEQRHRELIRYVRSMRADVTVRLIRLECVDVAGPLTITNLEAGGVVLTDVTAEKLFIAYSKLPGGVQLKHVAMANGVGIYASSVTGPLTIADSEIGNNPAWQLALGIVGSTVTSIGISKTAIGGKLDLSGLSAAEDVSLTGQTRVKGRLYARGAKIGGGLTLTDATIEGVTTLDYTSIAHMEIEKSTLAAEVYLDHARIEKQLSIRSGTTFAKYVSASFLSAGEFRVEKSSFSTDVSLRNAEIAALRLQDTQTADPDCADCTLTLGNANIHNLTLNNFRGFNIHAGNGRFRTFDARGGTIRKLDCTDCLVDQYLLLAAKMTGETNLSGADVKGTLMFSDGGARACWTREAELILSELRADAIAANAQDLMIDAEPGKADCTSPTAAFVRTRMTGARYRAITPGRFQQPNRDRRDAKTGPLIGLGSERLIAFIKSSSGTGKLEGYDPQPFEELAQALDRAGETEKAVDLRVAKIDARLETEGNPLVNAWYWLYKKINRYGFENGRAAVIFLVLLCVGAGVYASGRRKEAAELWRRDRFGSLLGLVLYGFWFSLDRAIPPLHLDPHMHDSSGLPWNARNYFYFHRVIGTLLISVAAAGAAGLGH